MAKLKATGDALLAEASSGDKIWGIGLTADDPKAREPEKWNGQNILGDILLDIRGDTVLFDSMRGRELYLYGRKVAEIEADFVYKRFAGKSKRYSFASVTFNPGGRRYDYLCDEKLEPGDHAVAMTSNGETVVTVEAVFEKTEAELAIPLKQYKKIMRKQ